MDEPRSACCDAPVDIGVKRGQITDLVPDNQCTECGGDLDVMDLRYDGGLYPGDSDG